MKPTIIMCLFLVFTFTFGWAASAILPEFIRSALNNNPTLQQHRLDVQVAEAQYQQAWADFWLPNVSAGANFSYLDPDTVERGRMIMPAYTFTNLNMPVIGTGGIPTGEHVPVPTLMPTGATTNQSVFADSYGLQLQVAKPLFLGFRLANVLKIRDLNLQLARQRLLDQEQAIKASVIQTHYNLLLLRENIRLSQELSETLRKRYESILANFRAGLVSDYDVLRVEVQYRNTLPAIQRLQTAYNTALQQFQQIVGAPLQPTGQLLDATNIVFRDTNHAEILDNILSNNFNLVQIRTSREIQNYTYKIQEAERLPAVNGFFNLRYDYRPDGSAGERKWTPSWTIGLSVSIPISDWLPFSKNAALLRETRLSQAKTDLTIRTIEDQLRLQVNTLLAQINDQKQAIGAQTLNMRQAQRGLQMANDRYQRGLASSLDVNDAETSYSQAQVNYLQAIYDYVNNVVRLKQLLYAL